VRRDAILGDGDYRCNAERLRTAYRKFDAGVRSAELLERLATTRNRCSAADHRR
jgi:hypothetical protein